jgi:hypothetical protein
MNRLKVLTARRPEWASRTLINAGFFGALLFAQYQTGPGTLELTIVDDLSGRPAPARVELLDADRKAYIASDALPVNGDCEDRQVPLDLTVERAIAMLSKNVENPYRQTTQFYSDGSSIVSSLPAGSYKLRVQRGMEYEVWEDDVRVGPGEIVKLTIRMRRWIDLAKLGWYSADDHLHIARPVRELNPFISKWMQAEDLHVANLLQMGLSKRFHATIQHAFGSESLYREGDYWLATGQENPRTHFLGHTITLGGNAPIDFRNEYLIYGNFWKEAHRQRALAGYAHLLSIFRGNRNGESAQYGLAIDLPLDLLSFVEILQDSTLGDAAWYEILNTGYRLTPVAGTDYPCKASYPGRERFYTRVKPPFTYDAWLDGVRRGATFITNGPALEFRINGRDLGDEIVLEKPQQVLVEARVRFDPKQENIQRLELIKNGQLIHSYPRLSNSPEISFRVNLKMDETAWLAVRARGRKITEVPNDAVAHSAPIYVTLKDTPPLSASPVGRAMATQWLAKLKDLEMRLAEDQIQYLAAPPVGDGVDEADIRRGRTGLLKAIESARARYENTVNGR